VEKEKINDDKKMILSEEVAQQQLDVLVDWYDVDPKDFDKGTEKSSAKSSCKKILNGIKKGRLTIEIKDDTIVIIQKIGKAGEELKYRELEGKHKLAMDKADEEYAKMFALIGSITGIGSGGIAKLKGADLSLAEALGTLLFLA